MKDLGFKRSMFMIAALLAITACSTMGTLSPRERLLDLTAKYSIAQEVAIAALQSGAVGNEAKAAIKSADATAVAAITKLASVTRGCERDPKTGEIILVDASQCEPSLAKSLFPTALAALTTLQDELVKSGQGKALKQ